MSPRATIDDSRAEITPSPAGSGDGTDSAVGADVVGRRVWIGLHTENRGQLGDRLFHFLSLLCALSLPAIAFVILATLLAHAASAIHLAGVSFLWRRSWNPVTDEYGALAFLFGTTLSSLLALLVAAPGALAVALFAVEVCPRALRAPIAFLTELLAAVPSVVYGLWALLVLVPVVRGPLGWAMLHAFGWTGMVRLPNFGVSIFTASLVLALMVFPVISAVAREVLQAVPVDQREATLALGATRWEMIRTGVLRNARLGLVGALLLGLGRALGETMAVAMVIGSHPSISRNLFAPGYTLGSVIANEFAEAATDRHLSALMELGLVLFAVTTIVNALARLLVWLVRREFLTGVNA